MPALGPADRTALRRGLFAAALWLLPVVVLLPFALELGIDIEGRALKSRGTREAADMRRLEAEFGADESLVLAFSAPPGMSLVDADRAALHASADRLRTADGVRGVEELETIGDDLACFLVTLQPGERPGEAVAHARNVVESARGELPAGVRLRATGSILGELTVAAALDREVRRIMPLAGGAMIAVLLLVYRRVRVALLVLLPSLGAIVVTKGLFAASGHRRDPISGLLEPVLLSVGVAASVHVIESFLRAVNRRAARSAIDEVREELSLPTALTSMTTMIGFLALLASPIPAVGNFGVFAAFGSAYASATALWFLPAWLGATSLRSPRSCGDRRGAIRLSRWLGTRRQALLTATALGTLVAVVSAASITVDNDPRRVLRADDSFRQDSAWIEARLGGVETFGLLVPAGSPAHSPENGALVAAEMLDQVGVRRMAGPPRISANGDLLLSGLLAPGGSAEREALFDRLETGLGELGFGDVRAVGRAVQVARDSGNLIRGQLLGLGVAAPLLLVTMALGLRSLRGGLLGLLPNLVPVALLYGGLSVLERPLSVSTVMIGTSLMGLIVDDTIHFLHNYSRWRRLGADASGAVTQALSVCARPITITSLVLAIGLGSSTFGTLETTVEFGACAAATVVIAWLLNIIVLPAVVLRQGGEA